MTTSAAEPAVNSMLAGIAGSLALGEAVSLLSSGTFGTRSRTARMGRNPRTGESLEVAASTVATLKLGRPLRASVNDGGTWIGFGNDRRQSGTGMPMMLNQAAFGMKTAGSPRLATRRKEPSGDKGFGPAMSTSRHQPDRTGRNITPVTIHHSEKRYALSSLDREGYDCFTASRHTFGVRERPCIESKRFEHANSPGSTTVPNTPNLVRWFSSSFFP